MNDSIACKSPVRETLRSIDIGAWAQVENPDGWTYHTNIGQLAHKAADKIEALEEALKEAVAAASEG